MSDYSPDELALRCAQACGIDYPLMLLVAPSGTVRRLLTGFGEPVEDWPALLRRAGIACEPDQVGVVRGGVDP